MAKKIKKVASIAPTKPRGNLPKRKSSKKRKRSDDGRFA